MHIKLGKVKEFEHFSTICKRNIMFLKMQVPLRHCPVANRVNRVSRLDLPLPEPL
jgi:hypothetical protein